MEIYLDLKKVVNNLNHYQLRYLQFRIGLIFSLVFLFYIFQYKQVCPSKKKKKPNSKCKIDLLRSLPIRKIVWALSGKTKANI